MNEVQKEEERALTKTGNIVVVKVADILDVVIGTVINIITSKTVPFTCSGLLYYD